MSAKLFYREFGYQEADIARFLADCHGFDTLYRTDGNPQVKRSKWFFVRQILLDILFLASRRGKIRSYGHIVALWHSGLAFIVLKWLGLIDYERLLWFGFSVRSPFWAKIYRQVAKLDPADTWFVVFTEKEVDDYAQRLGIDPQRLLFIAHGDWPQPIDLPKMFAPDPDLDLATPYYFTGGFTNRDYRPVIEAFRGLDQRLIIVCSRSNDDVVDAELPSNVQVYRDITFPEFELLLSASKAVIIPLRHDSGAAGHSVLVRSMRNGKIVIANAFRIMDNYVDNGIDGVLLEDMAVELRPTLLAIEADAERFAPIRRAALERFKRDYSQEALERRMSHLIQERWIEAPATAA
ncbi:MAG: glycosyltransferase [Rhizobiales bacterium]|nr:glycosyltransferase [Hyphomicrobiales bacterium]